MNNKTLIMLAIIAIALLFLFKKTNFSLGKYTSYINSVPSYNNSNDNNNNNYNSSPIDYIQVAINNIGRNDIIRVDSYCGQNNTLVGKVYFGDGTSDFTTLSNSC